ncbi:hypothetical protein CLOLEP_01964 [[Clostridium] leptum DSM 753]|uniref:Uncharacterized protein n=1 Tax=[Clostridium] leptum DSM 753 TaxID=428125 RepID=A7VTS2_9FIRM|nr:hypothetical protein CLOLEP_01964 [[Clostridium] leptum DSM 753]
MNKSTGAPLRKCENIGIIIIIEAMPARWKAWAWLLADAGFQKMCGWECHG